MKDQQGIIYLLCFSRPVSNHARHYLGWTSDLDRRIERHRAGTSQTKLVKAAVDQGITFQVVRVWVGTRTQERQMHRSRKHVRLCPHCTPKKTAVRSTIPRARLGARS